MGFVVCNESFRKRFETIWFDDLLDKIINEGNTEEFYFVSATNQLAWNFKLSFAERYFSEQNKPLVNFTISNLEGLVKRVFEATKPKNVGKVLSDSYRFLIFKEAFDRAKLQFFRQANEQVSLYVIRWLSQIIFGLKEDGITIDNFEKEIQRVDERLVNLPKFLDTKSLFEEYQTILQESNLFDIVDAINYSSNWLNDYFEKEAKTNRKIHLPFFDRNKTFLFFGFYDFKIPEIRFIGSISRYENPIAIFLDFDAENGPLFGNYVELIENLKKYGLYAFEVENENAETNVNFLKKYLFNNLSGKTKPELAEKIRICAVENRYKEAKQIAKLCKYLIAIKKYKPSEICITTKAPESYASLFREVFQEVGVPVNITERFRLNSSPLVLSILSALDVVAKGFRFKDIRKVLLSFYFRFLKKSEWDGQEEIDKENFLDVVTKMKGLGGEEFGGKEYWLRRFKTRLQVIDDRISFLKATPYPDQMELANLEKERKQVQRAKEDFEVLLNYFDFDSKEITVEQFYDIILNKIIKRFGVLKVLESVVENLLDSLQEYEKYDKIAKIEEVEKDSRALSKFFGLLEEFTLLTTIRYKDKKFSLKELLELFKVVIFEERFQISRKPSYGVTITTIEQTRGIPYKVMILCGAIDGDIPRKYSTEKFLGKELGKSEKRHFENERLEFFFFLTNNQKLFNQNERLTYIFYPKRDAKREFIPSPFLFSLFDLFPERKDEIFFDLTKPIVFENTDQMEWLNVIASTVERNLVSLNQEETQSSKQFYDDINSIYFKKNEVNYLLENKLTDETFQFFSGLTSKPISVTFLEDYNKCPYRFFVDRILRLERPPVEMELFLTNREKGEILHIIVSNFFKKLAEETYQNGNYEFIIDLGNKKYVPVKLQPEKKDEYFELISRITYDILQKFNTEISLFSIDTEEFISTEPGRIGLVQLWLNYELKRTKWGYYPCFFELSFGMNYQDSLSPVDIDLDGQNKISLRGKIDRIDVFKNGDNFDLLIIDYKLIESEVTTINDCLRGIAFQMPFYAIAFMKLFGEKGYDSPIVSLLYQIFKFRKDNKRKNEDSTFNYVKLFVNSESSIRLYFNIKKDEATKDDFLGWIEVTKLNALDILKKIKEKRDFPVKPFRSKNVCKYCQYKNICKIEVI
ncbi:hypothetical protein D9V84_06705 [Bacteroidetes/Chlorobi group bacterium Naka2016]|jgi:ATP-dependent helicase/DNAse subunit B|nr:MAG: hypothetical protein D9V84_06705 [Bacteroidetes/Chlorobi group bacterium Naka2016]